jgi:hypothetical protein
MRPPQDHPARLDPGMLPPVCLLAAGLGLGSACSVRAAVVAANDATLQGICADQDEPSPESGWRGWAEVVVDEMSHTGSWP